MYIDNLTLAGIFAAALYLLLPLLFGAEIVRVEEEGAREPTGLPCDDPVEDVC